MIDTRILTITPDIQALLSELDEFKGAWRALRTLAPERLAMLRQIATLLLLQAGYAYVPYASLEAIIEQSKDQYYLALRRTQKTIHNKDPDWKPWVLFFLRALQKQKRQLEDKVEREQRALIDLSPLALAALDYARAHGRVTNKDIVREEDASPNTIKTTLSKLVKQGLLARHGGGRSTWYSLP